MQRHKSIVTLRDMFLLLCTSSVIAHAQRPTNMADEVLHTEDNPCKPIRVNGELMPAVPEYMPSFPISLKGIKRQFVCKLAQSTTAQDTTTMSTTESTTSHPTTNTQSSTTQDTTTMATTESHNSHPTTTTPSTTSREATANSIPDSTIPNPTRTTKSTAKIFVTDTGTDEIFVADLQADLNFTSIPSTKRPRYITYDSVEKKIYWADYFEQRVYRADADGGNREELTFRNDNGPRGIAIAESSRTLYIAYKVSNEITTVDIGQGSAFPRNETNFITGLTDVPYSLEVDEEQGFLYWSMGGEILRKYLNGSGSTETVYSNNDLSKINGLTIDLSRNPRRIFFSDFNEERTFYKDVNQNLTMADELTDYMNDPDINDNEEGGTLPDISYFNGTLYWTKEGNHKGIAIMTNYDQGSRSFDIKETSEITGPFQLVITNVDP